MIVHWKDQKMSQKHVHASSINLCISEFDHFFSFSIWPWPVGFADFAVSVALTQNNGYGIPASRLHPRPPCMFQFWYQRLSNNSQVERTDLRWNLNKLKLVARLAGKATTSHRKSWHLAVKPRGTSMHAAQAVKTCDVLRSRLSNGLGFRLYD